MVKGISRRVVVVDAPDQRFFEQAIFFVRNDAAGQGVTARELVDEARKIARNCGGTTESGFSRFWHALSPLISALLGASIVAAAWIFTLI